MAKFKIGDEVYIKDTVSNGKYKINGTFDVGTETIYCLDDGSDQLKHFVTNAHKRTYSACQLTVFSEDQLEFYSELDKIWKPDTREKYYFISDQGEVDEYTNDGWGVDIGILEHGNCFKTSTEAQSITDALRVVLNSKEKRLQLIELSKT